MIGGSLSGCTGSHDRLRSPAVSQRMWKVNSDRTVMRLPCSPGACIVPVSKHLVGAALEQEVQHREPLVHVTPLVGGVPEPEEQHRLSADHSIRCYELNQEPAAPVVADSRAGHRPLDDGRAARK